ISSSPMTIPRIAIFPHRQTSPPSLFDSPAQFSCPTYRIHAGHDDILCGSWIYCADGGGDERSDAGEVAVAAQDQIGIDTAWLDISGMADSGALAIVGGDKLGVPIAPLPAHISEHTAEGAQVGIQVQKEFQVAALPDHRDMQRHQPFDEYHVRR